MTALPRNLDLPLPVQRDPASMSPSIIQQTQRCLFPGYNRHSEYFNFPLILTKAIQTPSPFRISRRQPSTRRAAGPQFANSPRFLLSQTTLQKRCDDLEIEDDDVPPSTAPVACTPAQPHSQAPPRRQRETIDDSDDGDMTRNTAVRGSGATEVIDDAIDSTPPREPETPGFLDTEFDVLFAPVRDSNKRRRLSGGNITLEEKLGRKSDTLPSSPPNIQQDVPWTPAPRPMPSAGPMNTGIQATPSASTRSIPPGLATPGSTKTPFRSKPRFMLAKKQSKPQTPFKADTPAASQPASPPGRRKPAFVLPRSPSPDATTDDIPAPFSPSSRTLHRRGRRSGVPGYTPGGMAAEVRSWILEVGSKREHVVPQKLNADAARISEDLSGYLVAARVVRARQTVLSSSGALAFVQAEPVSRPTNEESETKILNVIAMGPSRSKPDTCQFPTHTNGARTASIRVGDLVGIHRGLAWEVELGQFQGFSRAHGLQSLPSGQDDHENRKQRWLVAMEWDLIPTAT